MIINDPEFLIVREDPSLVRDTGSKALLQTDLRRKEDHMRKNAMLRSSMRSSATVNNRIDQLEKKVDQLIELLQKKLLE